MARTVSKTANRQPVPSPPSSRSGSDDERFDRENDRCDHQRNDGVTAADGSCYSRATSEYSVAESPEACACAVGATVAVSDHVPSTRTAAGRTAHRRGGAGASGTVVAGMPSPLPSRADWTGGRGRDDRERRGRQRCDEERRERSSGRRDREDGRCPHGVDGCDRQDGRCRHCDDGHRGRTPPSRSRSQHRPRVRVPGSDRERGKGGGEDRTGEGHGSRYNFQGRSYRDCVPHCEDFEHPVPRHPWHDERERGRGSRCHGSDAWARSGGRDGGERQHRPFCDKEPWERSSDGCDREDRHYPHRDDEEWGSGGRRCDRQEGRCRYRDDGHWGRKPPAREHSRHRPCIHNRPPHEQRQKTSGHNGLRSWSSRGSKRPKRSHHPTQPRGSSTDQQPSSPGPLSRHAQELQSLRAEWETLQRDNRRLQQEVHDMKESKCEHLFRPPSRNAAETPAAAGSQEDQAASTSMQYQFLDNNPVRFPGQQDQSDVDLPTTQTVKDSDASACYDMPTDEDNNFPSPDTAGRSAGADEREGEEDGDAEGNSADASSRRRSGNAHATADVPACSATDPPASGGPPCNGANVEFEEDVDRNGTEDSSDAKACAGTWSHRATSSGASDDESDADSVDVELRDQYDPTGQVAFCCQNCTCWTTARDKFVRCSGIRNNCGNTPSQNPTAGTFGYGNTKLWHKGCCHSDKTFSSDYQSPMMRAINEGWKEKPSTSRFDALENIKKSYATAKREETKFENEEFQEAKDQTVYTNEAFMDCSRKFQERNRQTRRRTPLRVLDLFSGIGSAAVVLKRLKLPVSIMVHVEHDPIAVEVCKFNHRDDGIKHHYIEKFEDIYGADEDPNSSLIAMLVETYGPFDLVLSGSPCQSYSGLNASRDQTSDNARYLCKVGWLIQKLDEIQMESEKANEKVLFVSENVVFGDHDEVDKCYTDHRGGLHPVCLDAKDFGPCKRNRFYWINMPVKSTEHVKNVASGVSIDGLLDDGYEAVARILLRDKELMTTPVKANAFLASLSRIDDSRMIRCKLEKGKHHISSYSVSERERMMGLATGYVSEPVSRLFNELTEDAFYRPESSADGKTYRHFLRRDFWHFRKKCHFKFHHSTQPPFFFQLSISSPQEAKSKPSFYLKDQYCKHLIGNGWSIPVVEHLLLSLRDLFDKDALKTYNRYNEKHPWEPYLSM